ncbi:GTP-binding protein EngA [Caenispirillum salinarum AK4]|uniref:GTPase Der n=1 Tax=Caenispirillum salinarum AK4 TaxID=1238182 RepID=K9HWJ6_9PROT|nr:ribosome biogenesis GTPase Der [Caenispirillum salinarum]EKV32571.1 GTP-binding protein EngA [Caenispirillum salinarum AK4]
MSFTVAIIGRPNVGKSTLFNRLVGRREAIVHDFPGVTRDRKEGRAQLAGLEFRVIDTAGLEEADPESLAGRMSAMTLGALDQADVCLLLIDARVGLTPADEHFANVLRKQSTPVLVVANKCEGKAGEPGLLEAYSLGLGEPIGVSAEHGTGMGDLFEALQPFARTAAHDEAAAAEMDEDVFDAVDLSDDETLAADEDPDAPAVTTEEDTEKPLRLAIVGRPNTGKSTLVNALIGEERLLTGPEAGVTRDSIAVDWTFRDRKLRLIDTAGMRRKARISDSLERLSVSETLNNIRMAEVVILMLDANMVMDKQDLTIARMVVEEGRALVIGINKWDAAEDKGATMQRMRDRLQTSLPQVRGIPFITLSALKGNGLDRLMQAVLDIHKVWNTRISTAALNRWLEYTLSQHPPPLGKTKRRIKLRYMTQAKARPPTFAVSCSLPEDLPESYVRYLVNGLRDDFGMDGVPIRMHFRKPKNPYAR